MLICLVIKKPKKKLNRIVTELYIRRRKLNISLVLISQSYFAVPKIIRLNSTNYFVMKIPNKREFQRIAFNHSSDIGFKDLINLYKKFISKPYSFLVIDTNLPSDNSLWFMKNILKRTQKLIMATNQDAKLQYNTNREAAEISGLSSGKIDKYEYLTSKQLKTKDKTS